MVISTYTTSRLPPYMMFLTPETSKFFSIIFPLPLSPLRPPPHDVAVDVVQKTTNKKFIFFAAAMVLVLMMLVTAAAPKFSLFFFGEFLYFDKNICCVQIHAIRSATAYTYGAGEVCYWAFNSCMYSSSALG